MSMRIDSKGRVTVPKSARDEWGAEPEDTVDLRVSTKDGDTQSVSDEIDSRGRVTIPKEKRTALGVGPGDHVSVEIIGLEAGGYVCDECDGEFDLGKVLILNSGERVVCAGCADVEDRIIQ